MSHAISLSRNALSAMQQRRLDLASSVIVIACAAALIFAGQPLPLL